MPSEVGAILSQGEHEFLKNRIPESFGRRPTADEIALHELEWSHIVKMVSKGRLLPEQALALKTTTPHMLENFAEIEDLSTGNFASLIRLGQRSKKAKLVEQYDAQFEKAA